MADKELRDWVSDQLYALVGFSEDALVGYVITLAKRASGTAGLASQLEGQGLPSGNATRSFATDLINRISRPSRKATASASYRQQEAQAAALAARNAQYGLLDDEDDDQMGPAPPPQPVEDEPDTKKKRKALRKKDKGKDVGEADHTVVRGGRRRRAWEEEEEANLDEIARKEAEEMLKDAEREADQAAKAEFEARLKERDEAKTRKLMEKKYTKEELDDIERRKYKDEDEKATLIPKLREVSRQEYLKKRELQKLEELRDSIDDEERMFAGVKLSRQERLDLEMRKQKLKYAEELLKAREALDNMDEYRMPDMIDDKTASKRYEMLTERYRDPDAEDAEAPWKEQENWENERLKKASMKVGAKAGRKKAGDEYDFVLEDAIDFVKQEMMDGNLELLEEEEDQAEVERKKREAEAKSAFEALQAERARLPVYPFRDDILKAVEEHQVLIIEGETGSGKTTQVPQYLVEAGYGKMGKIGCTQPRRVAAMSVAARVATEMGVKLGNEVGYSIRFEDCTSDKTVLKYMTDGMLLREFLGEPDLASYSVMIIDEAHERTLHTDILMCLIKDIARFRTDIKILISSATLDAEKFSDYFDNAPIFRIPGRRYPVDILYTKAPEADYLFASVATTITIHATQPPGDVLIFLTGQEEIEAAEELLKQKQKQMGSRLGELVIAPIYANLPSDMQSKIFETTPPGARKVVLATNIAETSLTIDGIKKINSYNPRSGMESLQVTPVSKASARQRAGRAGRTSPGKCFRLYTQWAYQNEMEDNTVPEIQRTNLGNVVLLLKSLGINDLINFDFMDPPPTETLLRALEQLYALGALNDRGELTTLGRKMAEFPLDPMLAKMIINSEKYGCSEEIATIAAMVSVGNSVFYRPKDKAVHADNAHKNFHRGNVGDHIGLMNVYNSWAETQFSQQWCFENFVQVRSMKRARDIREQLVGLMERTEIQLESNLDDNDAIRKAITSGFFYHTANLQKTGAYKTAMPRWVVYQELVLTSKEFMRTVSEIKPDWLVEVAPHMYSRKEIAELTAKKLPKQMGKAAEDAAQWPTNRDTPGHKTARDMYGKVYRRKGLLRDHVKQLDVPPGTMGWPIIGETFEWIGAQFSFYVSRREAHGSIYKSHILFKPTVFIAGEDILKEVFALEHKLVESSWPSTIQDLLGRGSLVVQQFNKHTQQRRIINQAFTRQTLAAYTPTVVSVVESYVARWVQAGRVRGYTEGKIMALDVAGAVLMGWRFDRQELEEFRQWYAQFVMGFMSLPFNLPWTRFGRGMQARAVLLDKIDGYIEEAMQPSNASSKGGNTPQVLMAAVDDEGRSATREELKDQALTNLFAGHETTATAVGFLLQILTKHPHVMARLREEQATIIAVHGFAVTVEVLESMPYAEAVVKEIIRYRPPVPMVWRRALEDLEVGGYRVPKGWQMMLMLGSTARSIPEWTDTAALFDPDRWLTDNQQGVRKDPRGYLLFGDGARVCPGRALAYLELKALLVSLARRASFSMVDPDEAWLPVGGPVNGLELDFKAYELP